MSFLRGIVLHLVIFVTFQGLVDLTAADCPSLDPVKNFNASAFAGRWYEVKRYRTLVDALGGSCASLNLTVNSSNNITIALNTLIKDRVVSTRNCAVMRSNGVFDWKFTLNVPLLPGET